MKIERKKEFRQVKIHHNKFLFWLIIVLLALLIWMLIYIKNNPSKTETNNQLANPASVYCIENGGTLNIVTVEDGSQSGICTLKNGTECDEWKYYRKEC